MYTEKVTGIKIKLINKEIKEMKILLFKNINLNNDIVLNTYFLNIPLLNNE